MVPTLEKYVARVDSFLSLEKCSCDKLKTFTCEICGTSLTASTSLAKHMATHEGYDNKEQCAGKRLRNYIKNHMRTKHGVEKACAA